MDHHYHNPRLTALYDLDSGWSVDRDFYLSLADGGKKSILDLGCGTGLLCNAYAEQGHDVTGADPAASMLDVARKKLHGKNIKWIQSTAQTFHSDNLFDLIIMTGHAFQVLMEDADVIQTFGVMRQYLKQGGCAVFESRNLDIDWQNRWNYDAPLDTPEGPVLETRRFTAMQSNRMTFDLGYKFKDETIVTKSMLRFWSQAEIEAHLATAGLRLNNLFGDWNRNPFDKSQSDEMIFVVS